MHVCCHWPRFATLITKSILTILLPLVLASSALTGFAPGARGDGLELPREALALLPSTYEVIVVVSDPARLDGELQSLYRRLDHATADTVSTAKFIEDIVPNAAAIVDPAHPVIVAWQLLPPLEVGGAQQIAILPLRPEIRDEAALSVLTGAARVEVVGNYAAIATDPDYQPAGESSGLVSGLPRGNLVIWADLETIVTLYRPAVEMGLMFLAQKQQAAAAADSTDASAEAQLLQSLEPQATAAMAEVVGGLMDSARNLTLTADLTDGQLEMRKFLTMVPGSVLDPGPQPAFTDAVAMTGYLPDDTAYLSASAIDVATQLEKFPALTDLLLQAATAEMPEQLADPYRAGLEQILATTHYWSQPAVQATDFTDTGFRYVLLLQADDAPAALEQIVSSYASFGSVAPGLSFESVSTREIAGLSATSYRMVLDEALLTVATEDTVSASEGEEFLDLQIMFDLVVPLFWTTTIGDLIVVCGDQRGETALAELIETVRKGAHPVPPAVSAAQAWSGERTQYLVVGDLRRMMASLVSVWAATGEADDKLPPAGDPIDVRFGVSVGEHLLQTAVQIDLVELIEFGALLEELENEAQ